MTTVTLQRYLDLPPDASEDGWVLRFGYQPGMTIVYRSRVSLLGPDGSRDDRDARLTIKVVDRDETDEGTSLILYLEPFRTVPQAERAIIYTKITDFGEVIESTDPAGGVSLLLPRMALATGVHWKEVERFLPPHRISGVEIVRRYHVASIIGSEVKIVFDAEPCVYEGEVEGFEDETSTLEGRGEFVFDTQWGVISRQRVETRMKSTHVGEVSSVQTLELLDE